MTLLPEIRPSGATEAHRRTPPLFERPGIDDAVWLAFAIVIFLLAGGRGADGGAPSGAPAPAAAAPVATAPSGAGADAMGTPPPSCDYFDHVERVRRATVLVRVDHDGNGAWDRAGTAFHVGGGRYVTAAHVVADPSGGNALAVGVWAHGAQPAAAQIVRTGRPPQNAGNAWRDIAELRSDPIDAVLETRPPGPSDEQRDVRVAGHPGTAVYGDAVAPDAPRASSLRGTVRKVLAVDGIDTIDVALASASPRLSGAAVVDDCGVVIAVISAPAASGGDQAIRAIAIHELERVTP